PQTFPHIPLFASKSFRGKSLRGLYGDVVEELDAEVGKILEAIRTEGIENNTFVFFTSDNGPWITYGWSGGSAGLLRDGEGSTFEGGMREPAIAWGPGRIPADTICRDMATTMDLFATMAKWGGGQVPTDRQIDGYDISELLLKGSGNIDRDAFFYYRGTQLF